MWTSYIADQIACFMIICTWRRFHIILCVASKSHCASKFVLPNCTSSYFASLPNWSFWATVVIVHCAFLSTCVMCVAVVCIYLCTTTCDYMGSNYGGPVARFSLSSILNAIFVHLYSCFSILNSLFVQLLQWPSSATLIIP